MLKNKMSKTKQTPDKMSVTKNVAFFLSRAPDHRSFTFNSLFLYELKHKARKTVLGIFHFRFCFVFIKVYIFV